MSEFLVYLLEEKGLVGYRRFSFYGIGLSMSDTIFTKNISEERNQRQVREEEGRNSALELLAKQTREREERARELAGNQIAVPEKLKEEQEREKAAKVKELQAKKEAFNSEVGRQRKTKDEEKKKKEEELRQQQIKMKELQGRLKQEKTKKDELVREKAQKNFSSRESELLDSIRETEIAISKLQARIQENLDLLSQRGKDTFQLLETIKRNQEAILRKEEEGFEWQQRYQSSEKIRQETQAAYEREEKGRQREEAETQLVKLEARLRVIDGNLIHKWYSKEFESLEQRASEVRRDFERGNYKAVGISLAGLLEEIETIDKKAYIDEKKECQRECLAKSFLKTLRYRGYNASMFQKDPKDGRSSVVIQGNAPSGSSIEITLPFGDVYRIKFSGMKESECCHEESAIREVMHKFGISWQALDPLNLSFLKNPSPGARFEFRDGDTKVELTKQICG